MLIPAPGAGMNAAGGDRLCGEEGGAATSGTMSGTDWEVNCNYTGKAV
jgi:hypothetical protein